MVMKVFQEDGIKEDDDLRSYINQGSWWDKEVDPKKGLSLFTAHIWMKKNIFLGEGS
jgi:hypothetical protein